MPFPLYIMIIIITAGIYIVGFVVVLRSNLTVYEWNDIGELLEYTRKAESKDVWKATIWPALFIWHIVKTLLGIIHLILSTLLLFFFIQYNRTALFTKIDKFLLS